MRLGCYQRGKGMVRKGHCDHSEREGAQQAWKGALSVLSLAFAAFIALFVSVLCCATLIGGCRCDTDSLFRSL